MKGQVLKVPTHVARRGKVWCEPLKLHFPQVYRIVKKKALRSTAASSCKLNEVILNCEFSLLKIKDERGIANAVPLGHLSSSDDRSLIVRHHRSALLASTYLQGVEDIDPTNACGGIYTTERGVFTITKRETRNSWPSPMIFYLADVYDDDPDFGVRIWERSVGIDGELRATELFNEDN